jgi:hypothetical protein
VPNVEGKRRVIVVYLIYPRFLVRLLLIVLLELLDSSELLDIFVYFFIYLPSYVGGGLSRPLPVVDVGSRKRAYFRDDHGHKNSR